MVNKDPISQLPSFNAELGKTEKKLHSIESILKRIGGIAGTSLKSLGAILRPGTGQGNSMQLGTTSAQFTNATSTTHAGGAMPWLYTKSGAATVGGIQFGLNVAGGMYNAIPDLGLTVARATGFYQSALRTGGGMNRAGVAQATFSALGGGVTSPGSDQYVSSILAQGYGYMPGTADFGRAVREVGGAARYLGMGNEAAAEAIGGLHTGAMGGNLYQYGISTFDPRTGKARTTGEIARQLFDRMTQGRKVTAEQMAISLREGFAGKSLKALGFSQNQQEIFGTILTNMAAGKGPTDLENAPFNPDNPLNAQMKIATSMTSLMERGTEPMIQGFNNAATAAAALNAQLEKLPDGFYKTKGFIQGFSNTPGGSVVGGVLGGVAAAAGTIAIAAGARKALASVAARSATSVISPAVQSALKAGGAKSVAATAGKVGLTGLGKAVPLIGGAVEGFGDGGLGSLARSVALSAGVGAIFGGGVPGALVAGGLTAVGWLGAKAIKSMFGTSANAATTQQSQTGTQMTAGMDPQLVQTLQNAGFSGASLNTAYGIVKAESGGRANAYNPVGLDDSYGLFQINMENNDPSNPNMGMRRNKEYLKKYASIGYKGPESLLDPNINARIAYDISKGGTNFNPWSTYTSGKYLNYTDGSASITAGNKTVNINVNLANASASEANALAKRVKEILLNDKDLQKVGSQ